MPSEPAPAVERAVAADALARRLGVVFNDPELFAQALRHISVVAERGEDPLRANERLELLGDAVLGLAVSEYLYRALPERGEGELTVLRSFVVRGTALAAAARRIGLEEALEVGRSARVVTARGWRSILASGFEALMGAVYLDQGWETARAVALRLLEPQVAEALNRAERNYKGELQELTQVRGGRAPTYVTVATEGPPHQPVFVVEVRLGQRVLGRGRAGSKKDAEQAAARAALAALAAATSSG